MLVSYLTKWILWFPFSRKALPLLLSKSIDYRFKSLFPEQLF